MSYILAIDDEVDNIRIINAMLKNEKYNLLTAYSGSEALNILEKEHESISVILLDKMMPEMSGIDLLKIIKKNKHLSNIPIIMQTADSEASQIIDGINEGIYYYLTKPYSKEILISLIESATKDVSINPEITKSVEKFSYITNMLNYCNISVENYADAQTASAFLSNLYDKPNKVVSGILELILNAIEHGNLGITYDEKKHHLIKGSFQQEVDRRQKLPENINKKVNITYIRRNNIITLNIKDQGNGFEWEKYLTLSPERATDPNGRGVLMANSLSFDELHFIGCGNEVNCIVKL